jgi:hypothetical protein
MVSVFLSGMTRTSPHKPHSIGFPHQRTSSLMREAINFLGGYHM